MSIRRKILGRVAFSFAALTIAAALMTRAQVEHALSEAVIEQLRSRAELTAQQLRFELLSAHSELAAFVQARDFRTAVRRQVRWPNRRDMRRVSQSLHQMQNSFPRIAESFVVDSRGRVILATAAQRVGLDLGRSNYVVLALEGYPVSRISCDAAGKAWLFHAFPVVWQDEIVAAVVFKSPADRLEALLRQGMGSQLDIRVVCPIDERHTYLSPGRSVPGGVVETGALGDRRVPVALAARGYSTSVTDGIDRRGRQVLAVTRHLAPLGACLLVQVDRDEALGAASLAGVWFSWPGLGLVVLALLLGRALVNGLAHPIERLAQVADRVRRGELRRQAPVAGDDELADIAFVLNLTARRLAGACHMLRRRFQTRNQELIQAHLELAQVQARLDHLSEVEPITGLANRRRFDEHLALEWRRCLRNGRPLAVARFELDTLRGVKGKRVDRKRVLRQAGEVLGEVAKRPGDLIACLGEGRFALLLSETFGDQALTVCDRLSRQLAEVEVPGPRSHSPVPLTVSCGIASVVPSRESAPRRLLKLAEDGLKRARKRGGNCTVLVYKERAKSAAQ